MEIDFSKVVGTMDILVGRFGFGPFWSFATYSIDPSDACTVTVGGANGHGAGVVRSLRQFDREERKQFRVPIVMRDSGRPPYSGTSTLTIVIGDLNDNPHHGAHKDITVYNYNGQFRFRLLISIATSSAGDVSG